LISLHLKFGQVLLAAEIGGMKVDQIEPAAHPSAATVVANGKYALSCASAIAVACSAVRIWVVRCPNLF